MDAPALQEQMARLADTALIGGERSDATDHCLAGIARLSSEVKDASSYLPTYDQRTYAEVAALYPQTTFLANFTLVVGDKGVAREVQRDASDICPQITLHLQDGPQKSIGRVVE